MLKTILVETSGRTTTVTLNRPDKLNAFNADIVRELQEAVYQAEKSETRVLLFKGEGKGFSGGFDLSDLESASDGDLLRRFVQVEELLQTVYHSPLATVAMVHGPCYGAAADLVAACKWRLGTPDCRFRMPGLRFGIVLGTKRLTNLVGADKARALLLRDKPFGAEEALDSGFLTEICEREVWDLRFDKIKHDGLALSAEAFEALSDRTVIDTRDADLVALIKSVCQGSIKDRITAYLETVKAKPKENRSR